MARLVVDHAATAALVGGDDLTLQHAWLDCAVPLRDGGNGVAGAAQALFDSGAGNGSGDPRVDGFLPRAGSPLRNGMQVTDDAFFIAAPYIGAFRDAADDWTAGWTHAIHR